MPGREIRACLDTCATANPTEAGEFLVAEVNDCLISSMQQESCEGTDSEELSS